MSATVNSGSRVRMRLTSCAAASDPPPRSKKLASGSDTGTPSTACHCSASQAADCPEARGIGLDPGQRPRQRGAVDLARRARREVVDDREQRHERRRQLLGEPGPGRGAVEPVGHGEVADEHLVARLGAAHGGRRAR